MKKFLLLFLLSVSTAGFAQFRNIYTYTNATSGAPASVDTGLNSTNLTGVGTGTNTPCATGFSGVDSFPLVNTFSTDSAAIEFTLTARPGNTIYASQISADLRASSTGPRLARFAYSTDGGVTWVAETRTHVPLNGSCGTGTTATWTGFCISTTGTVKFRIYPYYATGYGGTIQVLNMRVFGGVFQTSTIVYPTITSSGRDTFCTGGSVTLSAPSTFGFYTYQWLNSGVAIGGANTNRYTANTSGLYSLAMTGPIWCVDTTNTISVLVNTPPSAPSISPAGSFNICAFDSVVLSAPSGYTYQWRRNSTNIAGATNRTYAAQTAGTYQLVITNAAGCSASSSNYATLTIKATASDTVFQSGRMSFCSGDSVTLVGTTGASYTYQWYNGTSIIAGATTNTYTAHHSGNYNLHITATSGCETITNNQVVTEVTLPTISAASAPSFCIGGAVTLVVNSVAGATGINYQWRKDSVNISGATNANYTTSTSGSYFVFVSVPGSCAIGSNAIEVRANPIPTPVITFSGRTLRTQSYYRTYQWYLNTIAVAGATSSTLTAYNNGSYRVFVTDTNGCTKLSPEFALNTLGVDNVASENEVSIYPNPATNTVYVSYPETAKVIITSVEGKKEMEFNGTNELNIERLANGLHLISVYDRTGARITIQKLVKQ